jgi:hypothetical protein
MDDGLHIADYTIGDFEWWYFDVADPVSGYFLKIVFHIGTDPLRTRIFPQLAVSINTPAISESITHKLRINEIKADTNKCDISVGDEIKIQITDEEQAVYIIKIKLPEFTCNLRFLGELPGWKPLGSEVPQRAGKRRSAFSWVIPCPRASVDGEFFNRGNRYEFEHAVGYHDHNYIKVDKAHPLYMDDIITKWYWGKAYTETFTMIFMDIFSKSGRISSLMIADKNSIIHSSNNLVEARVSAERFDSTLKVKYASSLNVRSVDSSLRFDSTFSFYKMLDHRDLLNDVNPVIKWIIKKLVSKPVYHGIHARVNLKYGEVIQEGFGNYESMVFRGKLL